MVFQSRSLLKSPTLSRFLALPVLLCPLGAQEATPVLTEAQAITRALARPEWQALTQLPAKQTEGAALEARKRLMQVTAEYVAAFLAGKAVHDVN